MVSGKENGDVEKRGRMSCESTEKWVKARWVEGLIRHGDVFWMTKEVNAELGEDMEKVN